MNFLNQTALCLDLFKKIEKLDFKKGSKKMTEEHITATGGIKDKDLLDIGADFASDVASKTHKKTVMYALPIGAVIGVFMFLIGANYG